MRNALRHLRTGRGLTQGELGAAMGVSRQTINAIETGKYDPGLPLAMKIARVFTRKVEEVFELEDGD
jgi:putative transcriptional regulator